jgi:periplasmic protein TonB
MPNPGSLDTPYPNARVATAGGRSASSSTFALALVAATLLHTGLIMLVSIDGPAPGTGADSESALEILVLHGTERETTTPPTVNTLSQSDTVGVSSSDDAVFGDPATPASKEIKPDAPQPPMTAAPAMPDSETAVVPGMEPQSATEPEPDPFGADAVALSRPPPLPEPDLEPSISGPTESSASPPDPTEGMLEETPPDPATEVPPDPLDARERTIDAAQILASRGAEIDRLTADIQAKNSAYASRVRRKSVSAGTREFRYANYLGAWARKVERIGNLNYPQAARDQRMFGSLVLHVAVRSDGSVEQIRIVRSSGYDLLDEAAIRIVELAAPYAPFPPDIAAETDVLDIVRTWQFLQGGRMGWDREP